MAWNPNQNRPSKSRNKLSKDVRYSHWDDHLLVSLKEANGANISCSPKAWTRAESYKSVIDAWELKSMFLNKTGPGTGLRLHTSNKRRRDMASVRDYQRKWLNWRQVLNSIQLRTSQLGAQSKVQYGLTQISSVGMKWELQNVISRKITKFQFFWKLKCPSIGLVLSDWFSMS